MDAQRKGGSTENTAAPASCSPTQRSNRLRLPSSPQPPLCRLDNLRKGMGDSADRLRRLEKEYPWIPSERPHFGRPGSDYDWAATDADKASGGRGLGVCAFQRQALQQCCVCVSVGALCGAGHDSWPQLNGRLFGTRRPCTVPIPLCQPRFLLGVCSPLLCEGPMHPLLPKDIKKLP
jgi:hypothetical protein